MTVFLQVQRRIHHDDNFRRSQKNNGETCRDYAIMVMIVMMMVSSKEQFSQLAGFGTINAVGK